MYRLLWILGSMLIFAPYVFGYRNNIAPLTVNFIVGLAVVALSSVEADDNDRRDWEYRMIGLLGAGAVIAPFALAYDANLPAMWVSVIIGWFISVIALIRLYQEPLQILFGHPLLPRKH